MARTYDAEGRLVKERDLSKPKPKPTTTVTPTTPKPGGCLRIAIIAIAVLVLLGFLSAIVFGPKPRDVTVAGFDWTRTIEIEQLNTVSENGWTLPEGARQTRTSREVRDYRQVLDHYESVPYQVSEEVLDHYETYTTTVDNGDGTFDVEEHKEPVYRTETRTEWRDEPVYRREPIYDTKYYYDIERWEHERDVVTNGKDHSPQWGEVDLSEATGDHGIGKEREGTRSGEYGVTDTEGRRYTADEDLWKSLEEGDSLRVTVDSEGHITEVSRK